jgi:hypothetical protein
MFTTKGKNNENAKVSVYYNNYEPNAIDNLNLYYPVTRVYDNNPDPFERSYKTLDLYLDEHLNFTQQTSFLAISYPENFFQVRRATSFLASHAVKHYMALFH